MRAAPSYTHLILTRFNLGMRGNTAAVEAWHDHRFSLFEQFCLPSVEAQTCRDFTWLLLFDRATPRKFLPRLEAYKTYPNIRIHFIDGFDLRAIMQAIRSQIVDKTEYLITTMLDNDDALDRDHVARVQGQFRGQEFELLNFTQGFRYDLKRQRLYGCELFSNPFMSLIERIRPGQSFRSIAGCLPHSTIAARFPRISNIRSVPSWLQVVHGRNLQVTKTWGRRRVRLTKLREHFELDYEIPIKRESAAALWIQNMRARAERLVIDALSEERKNRIRRRLGTLRRR